MRENFPLSLIKQCNGVADMADLTSEIIQCMEAVYSCTFTTTTSDMSHKVTGETSDMTGKGATSDKYY